MWALQHSPRQEAMKGVGTGRSEGDGEPPSSLQTQAHAHARSRTATWAQHKSLSLTVWGDAGSGPSAGVLKWRMLHLFLLCHSLAGSFHQTGTIFTFTPQRGVKSTQMRSVGMDQDSLTGILCLLPFHPLQPPGLLFFIKVSFRNRLQ